MSLSTPKSVIGVTSVVCFLLFLWLKRPYKFPPGPLNIPIYGSQYFLPFGKRLEVQFLFQKLGEKYGGIFSVGWFAKRVVVLADYESIREALVQHGQDFADRPWSYRLKLINPLPPHYGILNSPYTEEWKRQRHVFSAVLRDLGYGKGRIETAILDELHHLKAVFLSQNGRSLDPQDNIADAVANVMSAVLFGERSDYGNADFRNAQRILKEGFRDTPPDGASDAIPVFLRSWLFPNFRKTLKRYKTNHRQIIDFLLKKIETHKSSRSCGERNVCKPTDFIEGYRQRVDFSGETENQLCQILGDFYQAGLETIVTAVSWGVYYLAANPGVQEKVYEEVMGVVGTGRAPILEDKDRMPYMESVVMETLRLSCTLPLAVPHTTRRDTEVKGYKIPRGTWVTACLWSVLRDHTRWPEPEVFNPERFLNKAGRVQRREDLIPFGIGRRACTGEQLATHQLFLFVTSLVRDFHIRVPRSHPLPEPEGTLDVTYRPPSYLVSFVSRS